MEQSTDQPMFCHEMLFIGALIPDNPLVSHTPLMQMLYTYFTKHSVSSYLPLRPVERIPYASHTLIQTLDGFRDLSQSFAVRIP